MPSDRFYRLPPGKREVIRSAVMKEFTRTSLENVSINQMIQDAGISRGSFYTYFKDKQDAFCYIMEDIQDTVITFCKNSLNEQRGNIWKMMEAAFGYVLEYGEAQNLWRLFANVNISPEYESMSPNPFSPSKDQLIRGTHFCEWLYEYSDKSDLRNNRREDFNLFVEMLFENLVWSLKEYYITKADRESIEKKYRKKLQMMKRGICKAGEEK